MKQLIARLKRQIIDALSLEDVQPEEIGTDEPLFGGGFGLDSIDALSLVVILEKEYGVEITDSEQGMAILYSVKTMAEHITQSTTPSQEEKT